MPRKKDDTKKKNSDKKLNIESDELILDETNIIIENNNENLVDNLDENLLENLDENLLENLDENLIEDPDQFLVEDLDKTLVEKSDQIENNILINKSSNIINIIKRINNENTKYSLNYNQLENILLDKFNNINDETDNTSNQSDKRLIYSFNDLKNIYNSFLESVMIIQIINGKIKYIEKKGYESRNQSVIDLLQKTNNHKKLPDSQFIFFTNDSIINNKLTRYPYIFTFCKNYSYNTTLFPNFNFNHWMESKIDNYEDIYDKFKNNQMLWNDKKNLIFWAGANTNNIRKKIYDSSKRYSNYSINLMNKNSTYIPIEETLKYKFLLNMNGHSYSGRLNYLFLTSSCVIILKNKNKEHNYEEFYYKYFIPNEDYIEIIYSDNENPDNIIRNINTAILNNDCESMAIKSYEKALKIFKIDNIYDNIYNIITDISKRSKIDIELENNIFYTHGLNYFYKDRLKIKDNKSDFYFSGKDIEFNILNENNSIINIKIIDDYTKIIYEDNILLEKYTPYILNDKRKQHYNITIINNNLSITVENKFKLINCDLPIDNFNISKINIKTELGGSWIN